ncbi:MAG: hypothetical protein ACRDTM_10380 [Micromonosporaceae bacterium]
MVDEAIEAIRSADRVVQAIVDRAWRIPTAITVRAVPYGCWRCGAEDYAVACLHEEESTGPYEVVYTSDPLPLTYARHLLALAGHEQAATIRPRRSKTRGDTYLSNGCLRCDALFGAFPVDEVVTSHAASDALDGLPMQNAGTADRSQFTGLGSRRPRRSRSRWRG